MTTSSNPNTAEVVLLSTFLKSEKFNQLAKNKEFQKYMLGQKELISNLLLTGFELTGGEDFQMPEIPKVEEMPRDMTSELNEVKERVSLPETPSEDIIGEVTTICSEITGYPKEMLEPELDLEADLGIDTVKQMEILSILKDKYNHLIDEGFALSETPTIKQVANYLSRN